MRDSCSMCDLGVRFLRDSMRDSSSMCDWGRGLWSVISPR